MILDLWYLIYTIKQFKSSSRTQRRNVLDFSQGYKAVHCTEQVPCKPTHPTLPVIHTWARTVLVTVHEQHPTRTRAAPYPYTSSILPIHEQYPTHTRARTLPVHEPARNLYTSPHHTHTQAAPYPYTSSTLPIHEQHPTHTWAAPYPYSSSTLPIHEQHPTHTRAAPYPYSSSTLPIHEQHPTRTRAASEQHPTRTRARTLPISCVVEAVRTVTWIEGKVEGEDAGGGPQQRGLDARILSILRDLRRVN